jgi:hypothetical protein
MIYNSSTDARLCYISSLNQSELNNHALNICVSNASIAVCSTGDNEMGGLK